MERRFLSPRETAEYIGCHVHIQTVYAWIARGEIPSVRIGRKVLVDRRRLDEMLETQLENQSGLRGLGGSRAPRLSPGPRLAGFGGETGDASG